MGLPKNKPSFFLSEEQYAIFFLMAWLGDLGKNVSPFNDRDPERDLRAPAIEAKISPAPLPS